MKALDFPFMCQNPKDEKLYYEIYDKLCPIVYDLKYHMFQETFGDGFQICYVFRVVSNEKRLLEYTGSRETRELNLELYQWTSHSE